MILIFFVNSTLSKYEKSHFDSLLVSFTLLMMIAAPNVIVTRSFPVATIFRIKRLPPTPITQLATMTTSGLQIRTVSAEVRMRIKWDTTVELL